MYYEQDPRSARYIERTVQEIPPSHRAAFTRVQAAVRAQYHADEETRRRNEFEVLLRGTDPGGALQIQNRRDPRGASAKKERHDRLKGFLETHAGKNNVGPAPFFVALYTALRLQTVPEAQGGAGQSRVEWEVDDGESASACEQGGGGITSRLRLRPDVLSPLLFAQPSGWKPGARTLWLRPSPLSKECVGIPLSRRVPQADAAPSFLLFLSPGPWLRRHPAQG